MSRPPGGRRPHGTRCCYFDRSELLPAGDAASISFEVAWASICIYGLASVLALGGVVDLRKA